MSTLQVNFPQIIHLASQDGMPIIKKRGILREYLQARFLASLYRQKHSAKLSFVGGTSLRILHGLNRFSEDLDFDNLGVNISQLENIIHESVSTFNKENIHCVVKTKHMGVNFYAELRFEKILHELGISTNPKEKMMIKVDIGDWWKGQQTQVKLMKRFGIIEQVLTNTPDQLLAQKLTAYVRRNQTQPRDMYDVVWLYSQNALLDKKILAKNNLSNILSLAINKIMNEPVTNKHKIKLAPFLFDESDASKLDLFANVLLQLKNE